MFRLLMLLHLILLISCAPANNSTPRKIVNNSGGVTATAFEERLAREAADPNAKRPQQTASSETFQPQYQKRHLPISGGGIAVTAFEERQAREAARNEPPRTQDPAYTLEFGPRGPRDPSATHKESQAATGFERRGVVHVTPRADETERSPLNGSQGTTGYEAHSSRTEAEIIAAIPEHTDEELALMPRDLRRTRIIEGMKCDIPHRAMVFTVQYRTRGVGLIGDHFSDDVFRWYVENDKICYEANFFEDFCNELPAVDLPNEREWLRASIGQNCR